MNRRGDPTILLSAVLPLAALCGCAVGPDFRPPSAPEVTQYTAAQQPTQTVASEGAGGEAQHFNSGADPPRQWWTLFQSPALDELVQRALSHSPTLTQARARLREAQADLEAQGGAMRWPAVDAAVAATREKVDPSALGVTGIPQPSPFTLYNASVSATYTLDVFGGNRRVLERVRAAVDYQRYEFEAARLTLAANVVTAGIRKAAVRAQIAATEAILQAQTQQLDIVQSRYRLGGIALIDLQNQRGLVAQSRAALPPLRKQSEQLGNLLATYLGEPPATAQIAAIGFDALRLPVEVPLSLPSNLAQQRPDIAAAMASLQQASAAVGVATTNLYPQFTLSASMGSERRQSGEIAAGINVWSIGAKLMQPIFHGGALRAQRRSAVAAYDAAAAAYQQTVLMALQQVADALRALEADADALQARNEAVERAESALTIASRQYQLGAISQSAWLDAQRQQLQTSIERIQAMSDRYADTAALLQALGGADWRAVAKDGS